MRAHQPTWTAERIELLKQCFEAGLSCREIACDIGVSRNAVIGKLSRLNLTRDDGQQGPTSDATGCHQETRCESGAKAPISDAQGRCTGSRSLRPPTSRSTTTHCCSLLELSKERCRWPISTPGAEDFRFCGNTPLEGLPYCAGHTRLAYRPGSRLRIARCRTARAMAPSERLTARCISVRTSFLHRARLPA